ncbi:hypothetical protein [Methylomonas fluvii]|uniref:Helix-turn-helix domain-containing protein n=1 Tax=Methylomonas fluvii TaxID=1854564 RepID=A0ABR9DGP3_9GAMM|nr:hypothetical protein [Methylomonas fluvii]MBD9361478.1 hypothetical protein [Methylomonas fluvii]
MAFQGRLSSAGTYLRENISGDLLVSELASLKEKYNCKTLKEIAQRSEYFDIREEPTEKGGNRIIYRIRPVIPPEKSSV